MREKERYYMNTLKWRDFKTNPPYDSKEDEEAGLDTDRVRAWFTWRHTHRGPGQPVNLSYKACEFFDGIFTEYSSHMRTSPYPVDWIEILNWVPQEEVQQLIKESIIK